MLLRIRPGRSVMIPLALAAAITAGAPAVTAAARSAAPQWSAPNADLAATRDAAGPIYSGSVARLSQAWSVPIVAATGPDRWPGAYSATPVVVDGVVYTQDLDSNVYAIELSTGKVLWTKVYGQAIPGPNGVSVAAGKVFGGTASNAFALDARTGQELWSKPLLRNETEGIDMAPGYNNGTVYISTVPGNSTHQNAAGGQGVVWALDARTGATKWKFETVPAGLWGHPDINAGGGLWYPPSFDRDGYLYIGVGNPLPILGTPDYPWASSRPGTNLYTDSVVKLDPRTGKVVWYNQITPHDIYDWDLQNSPVITQAAGRPVVIGSGKAGYVYEFDQATGRVLWKTPVGVHNGHDGDNLLALNGTFSPAFPYTIEPGVLGGMPSPPATDGRTVYVAVNNFPATWTAMGGGPSIDPSGASGELVALDLITGQIKWTHHFDSSPYGGTSVTNDLVFTVTFEGTIHALNTRTGEEVWSSTLPAVSNAPVAISGGYLLAGAGWPQTPGQQGQIIAYRLGGAS